MGWFLLEAQGSCYEVNRTLLAWIGRSRRPGTFLGLNWTLWIHPDSHADVHDAIDRIQGDQGVSTARIRFRSASGSVFDVIATFVPWHAQPGARRGFRHGIVVSTEQFAVGGTQACQTTSSRSRSASGS